MKGSVRKRGNKWSYYFDIGIVDGKRKKIEKGGFTTKKEAENALAAKLNEYNETSQLFTPSKMLLSDYLDEWFEMYCKVNLKYNTMKGYRNIINNHLKPNLGQYKLCALNHSQLQKYANSLKMNGFAKSHIVGILSVLRASLNYAVQPMELLKTNPMQYVHLPKVEKAPKQRIILTMEDWNTIITRFKNTHFYIPLMIGFYTGLRCSETFGLTWEDIDLENRTITVNKQAIKHDLCDINDAGNVVGEKGAPWCFGTPKTKSSNRVVPFGDALYNALKQEHSKQKQNELKHGENYIVYISKIEKDEKGNNLSRLIPVYKFLGEKYNRINLVCVNEYGKYVSSDSFKYCSRIIHHELQLAFDYHSLRHTHATILIESGANVKNVQARLGHEDIATTLQTYVHNTKKMDNETVDIFEKITTEQIEQKA